MKLRTIHPLICLLGPILWAQQGILAPDEPAPGEPSRYFVPGQEAVLRKLMAKDTLAPALADKRVHQKRFQLNYEAGSDSSVYATLRENEVLVLNAVVIPSAGYGWSVVGLDQDNLNLVAKQIKPIVHQGQTVERIVLTGKTKGQSSFRLLYCRPGQEDQALKEYLVSVDCEGAYRGAFRYSPPPPETAQAEPIREGTSTLSVSALPASFDWRDPANGSIVTSVKNQGNTNSCWAQGACGSFEAVVKRRTGITRDYSEQWLGDCNAYGFSVEGGGWFPQQMFQTYGAVLEQDDPLSTANKACRTYTYHEKATSWGYTDGVSDTPWPSFEHIATNDQIKQAIYDHGPIAANCYWDGTAGHIITLVGWNSTGWLVKNSWGTGNTGTYSMGGGYNNVPYNLWSMGMYSVWIETGDSTPPNTITASITSPNSNQTVASGTSVAFSGQATDSSPSATLSYAWDFGDGATASGTTANHVFTNTGSTAVTRTVTFKATDNTNASGTATRQITVNPGGSTNLSMNLQISVSGDTATFTPNTTGAVKVDYWVDSTGKVTKSTSPFTYTLGGLTKGTHNVYARAYNSSNANVDSGWKSFTISGTTTGLGVNLQVSVSAGKAVFNSNATGATKVTFWIDDASAASYVVTSSPWSYTFNTSGMTKGSNHWVMCRAEDGKGGYKDSSWVSFVVQ